MSDPNPKMRFPFSSVLSLNLLVEYWEKAIEAGTVPFAQTLSDYIKAAPKLKQPILDHSILEKHRELINFLMSAVIAPAQTERELTAATVPFKFESFYATKAFQRSIVLEELRESAKINVPGQDMVVGKTIQACLLILQQFYNVKINFDKPLLFNIRNSVTGLDKVYKVEIGRQFFEIVAHREVPPIDPHIIKFLTEKVYDVDLWLQYIRPEDFEFRGFMILRMVDVTEQEMVSSIKYDLLEKNAVSRKESFISIQQKMRSIFNMPDIKMGLAYFDSENNIILNSEKDAECWKSLSTNEFCDEGCNNFTGSVYERSWMEKRYITVENLETYPYKSIVEDALLANGIKNILLAPLIDDGETIGMLELATSNPGELNPITANKVESVLPMFTAAVKRVKEEMSMEVRAIIQEECTNIHPVVQWRFIEAGNKVLAKRRNGEKAVFEEIIFKDVYPLFGMADIRNSSLERTSAIQKDLQQNLKMVKELFQKINADKKLPALDETLFTLEAQLQKISEGLASGDESSVLEFLKQEINPLLVYFEKDIKFIKNIEKYRHHLDPVFGVVYKKRKNFEESLAMINKMISTNLNEAQVSAQQMFPHYFEKYQTDGIEYTLYVGNTLTKNKNFDAFYLRNFRLWQLLFMCETELRMVDLKPKLKVKLDLTQLILVHDQPLSIRFRPDEKQFDVDGAYDIRYEILKKRIDKALVKKTGDRLTQPGKIAIVYNQPKVEEEYKRYFQYLASKNLITNHVEDLELEELPGATGLKALRIEVKKAESLSTLKSEDLLRDIEAALRFQ